IRTCARRLIPCSSAPERCSAAGSGTPPWAAEKAAGTAPLPNRTRREPRYFGNANSMNEPVLLTPGPLTTSAATKSAMLCDWGSWDEAFNALTASVCADLVAIVEGQRDHVCVP